MEKKIYVKNVINLYDEFYQLGNIFGDSYAFNVLRGFTTSVNTPCIIIFANGTLESRESIDVVDAQLVDNPSLYLEENQDKAKSLNYILLIECHRLHNTVSVEDEFLIRSEYQSFINSLKTK